MPLFKLPQKAERTFKFTPEMQKLVDAGIMDASQVKKFDGFPDLLAEEVDNELAHPDISNLERDIFDAVYNNDPQKFFRCVVRVGVRPDLLERIYNWLLAKPDFNVKKDLPLLRRIEGAKSVFNIFDY